MNVAVVCELNPFHYGHYSIFRAARELSKIPRESIRRHARNGVISADVIDDILRGNGGKGSGGDVRSGSEIDSKGLVAAVMSGNFCERGEPATLDKWTRARIAVECGADVVAEIPSVYSASSAQFFADAAVDIVTGLGCVDVLLFGSECGDAKLLSEAVQKRLGVFEGSGILKIGEDAEESFPKAMERLLGVKLSGNDILAVEYMCALRRRGSATVPAVFKIKTAIDCLAGILGGAVKDHADEKKDADPALALHSGRIRAILELYAKNISESQWSSADMQDTIGKMLLMLGTAMPPEAFGIFSEKISAGEFVGGIEALGDIIVAAFRRMTPFDADALPFADDGLGRKILNECLKTGSPEIIINRSTGKSYTASRVKRTLISVITGAEQSMYTSEIAVPYVRILAIRRSVNVSDIAAAVSAECEKSGRKRNVIVGNIPSNYAKSFSEETVRLLEKEILASDMYALGVKVRRFGAARKEFTCRLISL